MNKIIITFGLALLSLAGQSQILISLLLGDKLNSPGLEFGIEGGMNSSLVSGFESKNFSNTFNMGFYFDITIKNQWSINTGLLVKSSLGLDMLTDDDMSKIGATVYTNLDSEILEGSYRHKMSYFIVPALIKYHLKNRLYAEIGPQAGLMYKSWIEFSSKIDDKDATIKEYNKDQINRLDFGFTGGIGYKLMERGWTIGIKYYYGLIDVYKAIPGTKNSSIYFKINIPVGAGKKIETKK